MAAFTGPHLGVDGERARIRCFWKGVVHAIHKPKNTPSNTKPRGQMTCAGGTPPMLPALVANMTPKFLTD